MEMESETSICPICGSSEFLSLPDHLNAHSKFDLIQLVLQKQHHDVLSNTPLESTASSNNKTVEGQVEIVPISAKNVTKRSNRATPERHNSGINNNTSVGASSCVAPQSSSASSRGHLQKKKILPLTAVNAFGAAQVLAVKSTPVPVNNDSNIIEEESNSNHNRNRIDVVPLRSIPSTPFSEEHDSSTSRYLSSEASCEVNETVFDGGNSCGEVLLLGQHFGEHSETSIGIDDTISEGHVQEESDNATSQTSIIKYIIDQTGTEAEEKQGEPERWILPDGRTIPVYSSFTSADHGPKAGTSGDSKAGIQTQNYSKISGNPAESARCVSLSSLDKHSGHSQLDLMTDEEIPPRGEISEYEESNTSSFVSEDSSVRLVNFNSDSRRGSPIAALELESIAASKRKRKRKTPGDIHTTVPQHSKFLCYECPKVEKFKSLFELIGHKMRAHAAKKQETFGPIADNNVPSCSSSSIRENDPVDDKFLSDPLADHEEPNQNISQKKSKEFFCVYCNYISPDKNSLAQHMETAHYDKPSKPEIYECSTCGKTFPARTNLRKHLLVHKERKHVCTTCSKGFTSNFKLMEHVRVHTKVYPYKCEVCEKSYRTPSLLNHHSKMVHSPEEERPVKQKVEYFCGVCHKVLRSKRSYMNHSQTHHAKPKKCPYCCETFIRPSVLVRHIRISHNPQFESAESKDCPICHKKLHPNSLIKHMRIHSNEKPYPCPVCNKHFRTYANLTSHSWSHTNHDRPFKCRICPKSYLFKKTLEHHMMVHKRRTLHFVCNECGVKFTNKVNMKRHLEEHYSEKKYKCKTCGKAFQRNYYLLEHERIHSGVKPFVCNICGKASTTKSNHRAHIKIHDARDAGNQEG